MKIGVVLPNWVGDLVMATPTLRALARRYPKSRLVGIGRPHLLPLLDGLPWLAETIAWEHRGPGWIGRTWRVIRKLRCERLDALLVLRNSGFAAGVARMTGAKQVIGYARRGSRAFLTRAIAPPRQGSKFTPISAVDYYLRLAEEFDCVTSNPRVELATTPADELAADRVWHNLRLPVPSEVVLLNVGGAYGQAKHWPRQHCIDLARKLASERGLSVVFLCGPDEREKAAELAAAATHPHVVSMAGEDVAFGPTKAVIRRAALLVTTDSGPRHIAAAVGTPTIALFGPLDPKWSENYQPGAVQLRLPLECSPCGKRVCPLGHHRCMKDLTPDLVLRAIDQILQGAPDRRAA